MNERMNEKEKVKERETNLPPIQENWKKLFRRKRLTTWLLRFENIQASVLDDWLGYKEMTKSSSDLSNHYYKNEAKIKKSKA